MQLKTDGLTTVPFELIVSEDTECYKSGSENDTQIVSTLIVEHEYKQPKDCADNVIMPIPFWFLRIWRLHGYFLFTSLDISC